MSIRNIGELYVSLHDQANSLRHTAYKGDGNAYAEGCLDTIRDVLTALAKLDEPVGIAEMIDAARGRTGEALK